MVVLIWKATSRLLVFLFIIASTSPIFLFDVCIYTTYTSHHHHVHYFAKKGLLRKKKNVNKKIGMKSWRKYEKELWAQALGWWWWWWWEERKLITLFSTPFPSLTSTTYNVMYVRKLYMYIMQCSIQKIFTDTHVFLSFYFLNLFFWTLTLCLYDVQESH